MDSKMSDQLPIYNPNSGAGKRENSSSSRSRSTVDKRVHVIPLIVLLCFFILWYFSSPVELPIKDGRISLENETEKPQPVDETDANLTILAFATPPNASLSVPHESLMVTTNNGTAPQPGGEG